jgi:hypothetical protein
MSVIFDVDELGISNKEPDLELKHLESFIGTTRYYRVWNVNVTDGVKYIMENGYSWFVTDSIIEIINLVRRYPDASNFMAVKLKVNKDKATAVVSFEDGNGKVYKRRRYEFTDAKRDLTLFYQDGVLMLSGEY